MLKNNFILLAIIFISACTPTSTPAPTSTPIPPTATHTPTVTPSPTMPYTPTLPSTSTPTPIILDIFLTLRGEFFFEVERLLEEGMSIWNEENGTEYEFTSIIYTYEELIKLDLSEVLLVKLIADDPDTEQKYLCQDFSGNCNTWCVEECADADAAIFIMDVSKWNGSGTDSSLVQLLYNEDFPERFHVGAGTDTEFYVAAYTHGVRNVELAYVQLVWREENGVQLILPLDLLFGEYLQINGFDALLWVRE